MPKCSLCFQPPAHCGRWSDRRADSFEVTIMPGFENMMTVPCCFKDHIDDFSKKWVVAKCPRGHNFDMYIIKSDAQTKLCGPYWRELVRAYDINLFDVVTFTFDPEEVANPEQCSVEVLDIDDKEKEWAIVLEEGFQCKHVITELRRTLHNTTFSNMADISDQEMCRVNWVIFKEHRKFDDEDFFEIAKFFVHRMNEQDLLELDIPTKHAQGYNIPCQGTAILVGMHVVDEIYGNYSFHKGKPIKIQMGWAELCARMNIATGSLIMVKIEIREQGIRLEVQDVNN